MAEGPHNSRKVRSKALLRAEPVDTREPAWVISILSRRELMRRAGVAAMLLAYASVPGTLKTAVAQASGGPRDGGLTEGQRRTLRSLWDAVIPGTWEGTVEDRLEDGTPAPGADDARVQDWFEQVTGTMPWPLDWTTETFVISWANDLDLWSDVFHGWPFDGRPKFWELPLDPSIWGRGRQHKILLMQALFHTLIDVKYQGHIILSKAAFYCDFWHEANSPETRVGREYIGFPLPPGRTPYTNFSYNRVLGDHDDRLITVNPQRGLVAVP